MAVPSTPPTKSPIRRALLITFAERYINFAANFVVTAITARLLTPDDFGVVAVGMATYFVITTVQDFGISNYIVQKQQLSRADARTGCVIIALLSALIAGVVLLTARPLSGFLHQAGLAPFMLVVGATTLVAAAGTPLLALMRRDMQFERLALVGLAMTVVNTVTVVGLTLLGLGHISFAFSLLAAAVTSSGLAMALRRDWWIYRPTLKEWRSALAFGIWSSLSDALSRGQDLMLVLVLGHGWPPATVGQFNRASFLANMPTKLLMAGIAPVALPRFAALSRSGGDLKRAYFQALSLKSCLLWPAVILLAILAEPIVLVLLGGQWLGAIPVLRILALGQIFVPPLAFAFAILSAAGAVKNAAVLGLVTLIAQAIVACLSVPYGAVVMAWALLGYTALSAALAVAVTRRIVGFTLREFALALVPSASVTALAIAGPLVLLALRHFRLDISIPEAFAIGAVAVIGWSAGLKITGHPLMLELESALATIAAKLTSMRPGLEQVRLQLRMMMSTARSKVLEAVVLSTKAWRRS